MKTDTRKRGTTLVEILIAVLVFSLGIGTIAAAMTYGLQTILNSKKTLVTDQKVLNTSEEYLMRRVIKHNVSPTNLVLEGGEITKINSAVPKFFKVCGKQMNFEIYRFQMKDKSDPIYVLEKK